MPTSVTEVAFAAAWHRVRTAFHATGVSEVPAVTIATMPIDAIGRSRPQVAMRESGNNL